LRKQPGVEARGERRRTSRQDAGGSEPSRPGGPSHEGESYKKIPESN